MKTGAIDLECDGTAHDPEKRRERGVSSLWCLIGVVHHCEHPLFPYICKTFELLAHLISAETFRSGYSCGTSYQLDVYLSTDS